MKHGGGECVFNDNNKVVDSGILTETEHVSSQKLAWRGEREGTPP
jgi:hypothetical protein